MAVRTKADETKSLGLWYIKVGDNVKHLDETGGGILDLKSEFDS